MKSSRYGTREDSNARTPLLPITPSAGVPFTTAAVADCDCRLSAPQSPNDLRCRSLLVNHLAVKKNIPTDNTRDVVSTDNNLDDEDEGAMVLYWCFTVS